MAFAKCTTCGRYDIAESHRCYPLFYVWDEEGSEDDAEPIYAMEAEDAAKAWAEQDDQHSAEYMIVSGRIEPTLCVRDTRDGEMTKWRVTGEATPTYYAEKLE